MPDQIKSCPCCGERIPVIHVKRSSFCGLLHIIQCYEEHGGCGTRSGKHNTKREAVRAWNRRAALAQKGETP